MAVLAEYIWIDGAKPTAGLRSKTKFITDPEVPPSTEIADVSEIDLSWFPVWGADGSSTEQASGDQSDIILRPVAAVRDPFRPENYLVMTEVFLDENTAHESNHRAGLRMVLDAGGAAHDSLFGFEQEYTFLNSYDRPLGFPDGGYPEGQGKYYCGVGAGRIIGRDVYEEFMAAIVDAGLAYSGANWEVMPGQAEFQIGAAGPLVASDHIWLARWILHRVAEDHNVRVTFEPKPAKGDWNGAGMHTNFSTKAMRQEGGMAAIERACVDLSKRVEEHLAVYGDGFEDRLTGAHETAHHSEFKWGVADRTASVRIPLHVGQAGHGYLEDRRPNANADPYSVATELIRTICHIEV